MTDRPIIMSGPMVRAILEGRKTQTRRLAWRVGGLTEAAKAQGLEPLQIGKPTIWQKVKPGDRLWVRETHTFETCQKIGWYEPPFNDGRPLKITDDPDWGKFWDQPHYKATDPAPDLAYDDLDDACCRWRSSIHMPRWASRLTLIVDDVRVERLQSINLHDAVQEGMCGVIEQKTWWYNGASHLREDNGPKRFPTSYAAFHALWEHLHGPGSWDANPEVVAITFTPHQCNIDAMESAPAGRRHEGRTQKA